MGVKDLIKSGREDETFFVCDFGNYGAAEKTER